MAIRASLKTFSLLFLMVIVSGTLTGCTTPVTNQSLPELSFQHMEPLSLNVSSVEIDQKFRLPFKAPNVGHLFPTPPTTALKNWLVRRINPIARQAGDRAVLTVHNAAVLEELLTKKVGLQAAFTKQQSERYTLTIEASLQIIDTMGFQKAITSVNNSRSITVSEDATINERDRIWFELTETTMKEFDAEMSQGIRQHLVNWIR